MDLEESGKENNEGFVEAEDITIGLVIPVESKIQPPETVHQAASPVSSPQQVCLHHRSLLVTLSDLKDIQGSMPSSTLPRIS